MRHSSLKSLVAAKMSAAGKSFGVRRFLDVLAQLFLPETLSGLILLLEEVSQSIIGELQEHRPRNLA